VLFGERVKAEQADLLIGQPVVAIPVRDEAERLPGLLKALGRQSWIRSSGSVLSVVLVLNNCRDGSLNIVRSLARDLPRLNLIRVEVEFPPGQAHVGSARRLAMETARTAGGPGAILISTDADAVPADDWVEANVRAIGNGADLVGGLIEGNPDEEALLGVGFIRRSARQLHHAKLVDRLTAILDPVSYDPWPRHSDHTGASLAVRAEVYRNLDGIPAIPCREDVAFVAKARRAGFRLRHAPEVRVRVSARLDGRAAGGMADCLQGWVKAERLGLPHLVEDPAFLLRRLAQRSPRAIILRQQFNNAPPPNEPPMLGVRGPEIDIDTAIARLERMIAANENT
jgi:hypothetical protein